MFEAVSREQQNDEALDAPGLPRVGLLSGKSLQKNAPGSSK